MIYPINIGLNLNQIKDYTTAECWLNYGEKGLKQTTEYLRTHSLRDKIIYCRKDIAYYLNYRYHMDVQTKEITPIFKIYNLSEVKSVLGNNNIEYFVMDRVSSVQRARPDIFDILGEYFVVEKVFGDFIILKKRSSLAA